MQVVQGAEANPTLLACLYAQSKCLKTSTYLGAPKEWRPMAVLDTERGAALRLRILSMTQAERDAAGVNEPVDPHFGPWIREGITFFHPGRDTWYQDCWEFATKIAPDFKTVIADTLTQTAVRSLTEVKGMQYEGVTKETKRVHLKSGSVTTVHPTRSDYGFAHDRVMEFITALDESPAHVLLISHEKTGEVSDAEGKVKRVIGGPRTVGNALLELIPSIMDVVLRLEVQGTGANTKLVLRSRNHNFFIAGDRSGLFRDGVVHNIPDFWAKLAGVVNMAKAGSIAPPGGNVVPMKQT